MSGIRTADLWIRGPVLSLGATEEPTASQSIIDGFIIELMHCERTEAFPLPHLRSPFVFC